MNEIDDDWEAESQEYADRIRTEFDCGLEEERRVNGT